MFAPGVGLLLRVSGEHVRAYCFPRTMGEHLVHAQPLGKCWGGLVVVLASRHVKPSDTRGA